MDEPALRSRPERVPVPSRLFRPTDVLAIGIGNGLLIVGMWVRHGGLAGLSSIGGILTAGGQLTALTTERLLTWTPGFDRYRAPA